MLNTKSLILLLISLCSAVSIFAQDSTTIQIPAITKNDVKASPIRFLVGGALELGGDEVAEVYFTNGNTQSVKAGQGGSIAVGAQLQIPSIEKLFFRATAGYKYVTTEADNVHIRLTRVPLHLTTHWMIAKKFHLGAGIASHHAIQFKADGIGEDIKFTSGVGPRIEIGYGGIGLTYTAMRYKDPRNNSYSANAIGVSFLALIPKK